MNFLRVCKCDNREWSYRCSLKCFNGSLVSYRDGIHLSAQGSKLVAAEILRVIKEAEWNPSLHWKSMPTEFAEDSPYDLVSADGKQTVNSSEWTYFWEEQWD